MLRTSQREFERMSTPTTLTRITRCPQCGASTRLDDGNRWRPFCSERCKLVDLGDWLNGRFAIPVPPEEAQDGNGLDADSSADLD
jgi:endogenous inhibitor of DNA gyrase (YacG/DUF329 family)